MKEALRKFILFLAVTIIANAQGRLIWAETAPKKNVRLDVYIENSYSMDGYVVGVMNDFKKNIYNFIQYSGITPENVKLYYINNSIIPQKSNDLRSFILNLTPQAFKAKGGERKSSDIAKVVADALKKVSVHHPKSAENTVAAPEQITVLVSDFIFSPGKKNRNNISAYLDFQEEDVKNSISKMLKENPEYAVALLQGKSDFNHWYYNVDDTIFDFSKENAVKRPYYIMIAGPSLAVADVFNNLKHNVKFENAYIAVSNETVASNQSVQFEVLPIEVAFQEKAGWDYYLEKNKNTEKNNTHITDASMDSSKVFKFTVLADFSKLPLPLSYLNNAENYEFEPNVFEVESVVPLTDKDKEKIKADIKKLNNKKKQDSEDSDSHINNYTHKLIIKNKYKKIVNSKPLKIKIKKNMAWIAEANDNIGSSEGWLVGKKVNTDKLAEIENTTFGLQKFIDGIEKAYDNRGNAEYYSNDLEIYIER